MKPSLNPFRAKAIAAQRYVMTPAEFTLLKQRVRDNDFIACIRGPHGTGKSTLLEDLNRALQSDGYQLQWHYLHRGSSKNRRREVMQAILEAPAEVIHCLDGGETIGVCKWWLFIWRLKARRRRMLATTHWPSPLRCVHRTRTNYTQALQLTRALAAGHWNEELQQLASDSFKRNHGNCREVFRDCYFYCSDL